MSYSYYITQYLKHLVGWHIVLNTTEKVHVHNFSRGFAWRMDLIRFWSAVLN